MNSAKQKLLLEMMVSSPDTFAQCKSIVKSSYFDPDLRSSVEYIHEYYDKYHTIPSSEQIEAETDTKIKTRQITSSEVKYCTDEIETFCRRKAIQSAIRSAPQFIEEGDYGRVEAMIRDAIAVSLNRNLGTSYFDKPEVRLKALEEQMARITTGWGELDELMSGGLARGEILMASANSGGGKSVFLANLALNFVERGFHVLYISLELSEELISQRFDTMLTGIPSQVARGRSEEIARAIYAAKEKAGSLHVKYMPAGSNANDIRAYLKEFELQHGFIPDMLVCDYLDLMGSNEKISAEAVFEKDKASTEQLRALGIEYQMFMATASQQNRSAIEAKELNHSHIAGGLSKINTVDWYVSIIMNSAMKAAGEIDFLFLKTRSSDGVGKTAHLGWNNNSLRITSRSQVKNEPPISKALPTRGKLSIMDLMND